MAENRHYQLSQTCSSEVVPTASGLSIVPQQFHSGKPKQNGELPLQRLKL